MNVALWMLQVSLALLFIGAGAPKLLRPRKRLEAHKRATHSMTERQLRLLGLAEVLGAAGLILPRALGIAVGLTPLAAACLFVLMLGAMSAKQRSGESPALPLAAAVGCALVALFRLQAD